MKTYVKMQVVASFGKLHSMDWQSLVPLDLTTAPESSDHSPANDSCCETVGDSYSDATKLEHCAEIAKKVPSSQ